MENYSFKLSEAPAQLIIVDLFDKYKRDEEKETFPQYFKTNLPILQLITLQILCMYVIHS